MTPVEFAEILAVAFGAGIFGAMLGLGGGVILVPALIAVMHVEPRVAVAASVVSVIATSSAAAVAYVRDHYTNIRLGLLLETSTSSGAIAGAFVARYLSGEVVAGLFSALLLYAAFSIVRPAAAASVAAEAEAPGGIAGSYYDEAAMRQVQYRVHRLHEGLSAGLFAGMVSAILGVGGGIVKVPVMTTRMGVPIRVAIATSNFMIGITAVATAIPYYASGLVNPYLAAPCALGVLAGARTGVRLARRTRTRYMRGAFSLVLLYTSYTMARRAGVLP